MHNFLEMTEAKLLSPEIRPELQITEIGPIFNHLALEAIDQAEANYSLDDEAVRSINFLDSPIMANLGPFYCSLREELITTANATSDKLSDEVSEVIRRLLWLPIGPKEMKPTHYSVKSHVLGEGLESGLSMPFHIYTGYYAQRNFGKVDAKEVGRLPLDPLNFVATLGSKSFQATLLAASHTKNGLYASPSTRFDLDVIKNPLFEIDPRPFGEDFSLNGAARHFLKDALNFANTVPTSIEQRSDGCPVRRSHYPALGEHALRYAELRGIPPVELQAPGKSAIIRSCEYIVSCMCKVLELREESASQAPYLP